MNRIECMTESSCSDLRRKNTNKKKTKSKTNHTETFIAKQNQTKSSDALMIIMTIAVGHSLPSAQRRRTEELAEGGLEPGRVLLPER